MTSRERQRAGARREGAKPVMEKRVNPKKRKVSMRTIIGSFVMFIGVLLLLADPLKTLLVQNAVNTNLLGNLTAEQLAANEELEVSYDGSRIEAMSVTNVVNAVATVDPKDLPTVAGVAIPDLGVNLPIYKGASNEAMYMGAVTLTKDKMGVGNYFISSHHSKYPGVLFQPLTKAEVGTTVYTTDLKTMYTWEISDVYEVTPDRVDVMDTTPFPQLTMMTCTYDLEHRIIVEAQLVSKTPIEQASKEAVEAFGLPVQNDVGQHG